MAMTSPSARYLDAIDDYIAIGNQYGVELNLKRMQCISKSDALVQAVEHTRATSLFARIPNSFIPGWRRVQLGLLRQQLASRNCALYTVEPKAVDDWSPSVTVKATR